MNEQPVTATKYQGLEGEDPTAPFWGSGNYVGPYWSDGKVQSSVEWGESPALHALDELARKHDAAYAHYSDDKHRAAADEIFASEARKLKQKFGDKLADDPQVAAALVEYGNYAARKAKKLVTLAAGANFKNGFGLGGLVKAGVDNIREMNARLHGTHLKTEKADILAFYETDPRNKGKTLTKQDASGTNGGSPSENKSKETRSAAGIKQIEVRPASFSAREEHNQDLVRSQHQRLKNYRALHDAAQASITKPRPRVYQKRKFNLNRAIPKKHWKKTNAVRPL